MLSKLDDFLIERLFEPLLGFAIHTFGSSKAWVLTQVLLAGAAVGGACLISSALSGTFETDVAPAFLVMQGLTVFSGIAIARGQSNTADAVPRERILLFIPRISVLVVFTVLIGVTMPFFIGARALPEGRHISMVVCMLFFLAANLAFIYLLACRVPPPRQRTAPLPHAV